MKPIGRMVGAVVVAALLAGVAGCNKAASNTMSGASSATGMSAAASAVATGKTLMDQLGGLSGVTKLAEAFGVNLASNPAISKFLDAAAITQVKNGLVNEVAKASGVAAPFAGADLVSALSGKGIDASGAAALTSSLASAADKAKLGATEKASLMALLTPITSSLLGK